MSDDEYHGHMTHKDGSHTPLSKKEAQALWDHLEEDDKKRAAEMPEPWDATRQIIRAKERLRKLGWAEGGGFAVKKGDDCAVIELGSTGMWSGWLDHEGKYIHYAGDCSHRRKVWAKPLNKLTDAEREKMKDGDRDAAESMEHECRAMAAMSEFEQSL